MSMRAILLIAIVVGLLPAPAAAQSLPNEIIGHRIPVPGITVDGTTTRLSEVERELVDALPAQKQAERLLQYSISHQAGATDEVKARVAAWRGVISITDAMATLLDV